MRHRCSLVTLATLLVCPIAIAASPGHPLPAIAPHLLAQAGAADAAFSPLRTDFGRLYQSLKNSRGLGEEDQPALRAMLQRVDEFNTRFSGHAGGTAMGLQLSLWLGDDTRTAEFFDRMSSLLPGDAGLALSRLKYREATEKLTEDQLLAEYEQLHERFNDNREVISSLAGRLKSQAHYAEAIAVLRSVEFTAPQDAKQLSDLADCLFAEHQFAEAAKIVGDLNTTGIQNFQVRNDIERLKTTAVEYVDLWAKEQELRARETELDDLPRVEIETTRGRIVVELFENEAPNTVANFISLAESDFYKGTRFHRWEPDFMIQGGDPLSREGATGVPGTGDPGYFIPDEHTLEGHRVHFSDSLAMAKTSAPNTGGCQFYLNHRPTPWLNGQHTVFGRVIQGHDLARSLRKNDEIVAVRVLRKRDHPYEPRTLPK